MLGERGRRGRHERNALVGRPEQHVERHARQRRGARIEAAERTDGVARAEQAGVEEIRTHASGFQFELAEAQYAEVEAEADEVGLVHGAATLYCAPMRIITLNANGIRSAARKGFFDWLPGRTPTWSACRRPSASASSSTDPIFRPGGLPLLLLRRGQERATAAWPSTRASSRTAVVTGYGSSEFDTEGRYIEAQFKRSERRLGLPAVGLVERGAPAGEVPLSR